MYAPGFYKGANTLRSVLENCKRQRLRRSNDDKRSPLQCAYLVSGLSWYCANDRLLTKTKYGEPLHSNMPVPYCELRVRPNSQHCTPTSPPKAQRNFASRSQHAHYVYYTRRQSQTRVAEVALLDESSYVEVYLTYDSSPSKKANVGP